MSVNGATKTRIKILGMLMGQLSEESCDLDTPQLLNEILDTVMNDLVNCDIPSFISGVLVDQIQHGYFLDTVDA